MASTGMQIRAEIDIEIGRLLVLINGAGIIGLLTFLGSIIENEKFTQLIPSSILGLVILSAGVLFALTFLRCSRVCSLHYEQNGMNKPVGKEYRPCICSLVSMYLSGLAFATCALYLGISWWLALPPNWK